jgi:DNA-binding NarL/FixJ family response regulator
VSEDDSKTRILIIDDTEANRYALSRVLTKAGFEVLEGGCGEDAFRLVKAKPDLIVLDIHLPDMLGFEVCKRLKADAETQAIPILHLSASYIHTDDKIHGLDSGADAYLFQPVEPMELLATIRALLRIRTTEKALRQTEQELKSLNAALENRVRERTSVAENRTEQLRLMAGTLSRVEQRERKKIATELHDHLAQLLVVCKMRLSMIHGASASDREHIEKLNEFLLQALGYSRTFISELSPMGLHEGGLVAGLGILVPKMAKNGLTVTVHGEDREYAMGEEVLSTAFQATRELLFNVLKHSGATSATVDITGDKANAYIKVTDQGKGFDAGAAETSPKSDGGFGLFNIRERLAFLGASLSIDSAPGKGTTALISVPLVVQEPAAEKSGIRTALDEEVAPSGSPSRIRVMIVDDHEIMRDGLRRILNECPDIQVVAEAVDGRDAVEKARVYAPQVVMMDISMPRMNGVDATRQITTENPNIHVMGLSMHTDDAMGDALRRAGAEGYLSKDAPCDLVCAMVRKLGMQKAG